MKRTSLFILLSMILLSCEKSKSLDSIISDLDKEDLSLFENISIVHRGFGGVGQSQIYLLSKINHNCRPYVIEYNSIKNEIVNIDEELQQKSESGRNCDIKWKRRT